jgi:hypothetical protein
MTAGMRRRARRGKSNHLSNGLATFRRHRSAHHRSIKANLLGQAWFREVVAVAVFLAPKVHPEINRIQDVTALDRSRVRWQGRAAWLRRVKLQMGATVVSLHNISYQTLYKYQKLLGGCLAEVSSFQFR